MVASEVRGRTVNKALRQLAARDAEMLQVLRALGDPVRLSVVRTLATAKSPMCCAEFGLGVSKSTATYHFRVLRESAIISQYEQGTARYSELRVAEMERRFPGLLRAVLGRQPVQIA